MEAESAFDLGGNLPKVNGNVKLIKGYFDESLPGFLDEHEEKAAFIHIDCDLYSSAKTVLSILKDRIVKGTVIVFDEYFNYPGWEQHEYKAFQEFVNENNVKYEYVGFVDKCVQVAVKILEI